jgi:hypothetical protein
MTNQDKSKDKYYIAKVHTFIKECINEALDESDYKSVHYLTEFFVKRPESEPEPKPEPELKPESTVKTPPTTFKEMKAFLQNNPETESTDINNGHTDTSHTEQVGKNEFLDHPYINIEDTQGCIPIQQKERDVFLKYFARLVLEFGEIKIDRPFTVQHLVVLYNKYFNMKFHNRVCRPSRPDTLATRFIISEMLVQLRKWGYLLNTRRPTKCRYHILTKEGYDRLLKEYPVTKGSSIEPTVYTLEDAVVEPTDEVSKHIPEVETTEVDAVVETTKTDEKLYRVEMKETEVIRLPNIRPNPGNKNIRQVGLNLS